MISLRANGIFLNEAIIDDHPNDYTTDPLYFPGCRT